MPKIDTSHENAWFKKWFNSPYYSILYKNRNDEEAQLFINNLLKNLHIPIKAKILDLACGKGRHAIYLNSLGHDVCGIDISTESISYASKFSNEGLQFEVYDMRTPYRENYFDYVLNLFTSFGYFEEENENLSALRSIHKNLNPGGILVIDFLNVALLNENCLHEEQKTIDEIGFRIRKFVQNKFIIKEIAVEDAEKEFVFEEKVQLLSLGDFENYLNKTGFKIVTLHGDYFMNTFRKEDSPRLIIVAKKVHH